MESIPDRVHAALADADVAIAYLFGSRARGEATSSSDADVAVLADRLMGLRERARLANDLASGLEVSQVDLIVLDDAPLELRGRVVQEGQLLYSRDEPRRVAFETRTRSEWFDYRPTLHALTSEYLRRVARQGL